MSDDTPSRLPSAVPPLDRAALERVLARAAELQLGSTDSSEEMSESQLIALGEEVGISGRYLRQALAEERTRVPAPARGARAATWFGEPTIAVQRVVSGTPAAVLSRIDSVMQREELMQIRRRFDDRITWEARRDFWVNLKRGFNTSGRPYALTHAEEVGATAVAVDGERTLVRLDADLANTRRRFVVGTVASGVSTALVAGGLVALGIAIPGSSLPIAALLGGIGGSIGGGVTWSLLATSRRRAERVRLVLEQVLDQIEHGSPRRSQGLLDLIDAVGR